MKRPSTQFGAMIRDARLALDEPQWRIAQDVGVLPSVLSGMETGTYQVEPSAALIVKLANRLKMPVVELLRTGRSDFRVWSRAFAEPTAGRR